MGTHEDLLSCALWTTNSTHHSWRNLWTDQTTKVSGNLQGLRRFLPSCRREDPLRPVRPRSRHQATDEGKTRDSLANRLSREPSREIIRVSFTKESET